VREFEDTLTEVTSRAGRAGRLPGVAAVRARGEQRRRRKQAGATVLSVALLTGLAAGLLNGNVLGSAERTPQPPPAHSGPLTPPSTTTTRPTSTPSAVAKPAPSTLDPKGRAAEQRRLAAEKQARLQTLTAAELSKRAEQLQRHSVISAGTTTEPRP
jgi:hypothetical protein